MLPRAHVDSLRRFLVIQDTTQHTFFGGEILPIGDINGGGASDILICRNTGSSLDTEWAFLYYGGPNATGLPVKSFANLKPVMGNIGDINGDGYPDIGMMQLPSTDYGIYFGGPGFTDVPSFTFHNHLSPTVPAIRLSNRNILELPLARSINGGFVDIFRIDNQRDTIPEFTLPDTTASFGSNMAVGDFNGDGYPDLAIAGCHFADHGYVKFYWGGPNFDTIPDFEIYSNSAQFGRILLSLGDFNGDGYDDILICGGDDSACGIYYGGPHMHSKPDVTVNQMRGGFGHFAPTAAACIGDFNHDGYPDFALSYDNVALGQYSVSIFLGGPRSDTSIVGDIFIDDLMLPSTTESAWMFGETLAGIGDFDGDGIDDIAVSSRNYGNAPWWGQVHIICGYQGQSTDVRVTHESTHPKTFALHSNYPNPFNPTTTISFDLPRAERTSLIVYDVLGRQIKSLLVQRLSAGTYRVQWDGTNNRGVRVASGIYFCKIATSNFKKSIKMILAR